MRNQTYQFSLIVRAMLRPYHGFLSGKTGASYQRHPFTKPEVMLEIYYAGPRYQNLLHKLSGVCVTVHQQKPIAADACNICSRAGSGSASGMS